MNESALREVGAVLQSDLRTSGASTLAELRAAAAESLRSLLPKAHAITVKPDPSDPTCINILIEGPVMTGALAMKFQTAPS